MMGVIDSLVSRREGKIVVEECRRCGTTIDDGGPSCPVCESDEIITYTIR